MERSPGLGSTKKDMSLSLLRTYPGTQNYRPTTTSKFPPPAVCSGPVLLNDSMMRLVSLLAMTAPAVFALDAFPASALRGSTGESDGTISVQH